MKFLLAEIEILGLQKELPLGSWQGTNIAVPPFKSGPHRKMAELVGAFYPGKKALGKTCSSLPIPKRDLKMEILLSIGAWSATYLEVFKVSLVWSLSNLIISFFFFCLFRRFR